MKRAAPGRRSRRLKDLAVDPSEVALATAVRRQFQGQDDAAAVGLFLPARSLTEHSETIVGMRGLRLLR
jgi:hypothetical protein